ncbi:hypothetical protein Rhe02_88440 [Rhizocola hellebori]|uniref:GH18 domain-containing protein n=2 Tax=Rhizocola hellebori TaxID=1392758 RepID=A0A8J3QJG5_9ACTN|nr:hypothetical protein Rhe02_88440 [Rhizocola hellebori]
MLVAGTLVALHAESSGTPEAAARGTGKDALWLGHAWLDGRKAQADVDSLVAQLRTTGVHDLLVHAGPLELDGALDLGRIPRAQWFTAAIHQALPGVRVQAWLGAHRVPDETPVKDVLDLGFDGVHYDFEPVAEGDDRLISLLRKTHEVTRQHGAILSVSAIHTEPWPGVAAGMNLIPGQLALWSTAYLGRVAQEVDQIAVMSYDTALPTEAAYAGYLKRVTENALRVVPPRVALLMGVPAYHDERFLRYDRAETMAAAVHGIRLALGSTPPQRDFGVALYVDFAATEQDWASYRRDWADPPAVG